MAHLTDGECERIVVDIRKAFGRAPLLSSDDQDRYYGIMKGLIKRTPPRDIVEMMLIRDTTNDMWEVLRCDRNKALIYESELRQRLTFQKKRQLENDEMKVAQEQEAAEFKGHPQDDELTAKEERLIRLHGVIDETPQAVDELLARAEAELTHSRTMQVLMPFLQQLGDMRSHSIDRYREGVDLLERHYGASRIHEGDDVVEAEYEMRTPDGQPVDAALVLDEKED